MSLPHLLGATGAAVAAAELEAAGKAAGAAVAAAALEAAGKAAGAAVATAEGKAAGKALVPVAFAVRKCGKLEFLGMTLAKQRSIA